MQNNQQQQQQQQQRQQLEVTLSPSQHRAFEVKRLMHLPAGVCACGMVGFAYSMSVLLHALKNSYGLSSDDLTLIGGISFVVQFQTWIGGFFFDRVGPEPILVAVALLCSGGWLLFALCLNGFISHSIAALTTYQCLLLIMTGMTDPPANLSTLYLFDDRSLVLQVIKTEMGVAASFLATMYICLFKPDGGGGEPTVEESKNAGINYAVFGVVMAIVWGSGAIHGLFEAPMLRAIRSRSFFSSDVIKEEDRLMSREDELRVLHIRESKLEVLSASTFSHQHQQEPGELSQALQAAIVQHVPLDVRCTRLARFLMALNIVYLTTVSITMLYTHPSAPVRIGIASVAVVLQFSFYLVPLFARTCWAPTRALKVTFPTMQRLERLEAEAAAAQEAEAANSSARSSGEDLRSVPSSTSGGDANVDTSAVVNSGPASSPSSPAEAAPHSHADDDDDDGDGDAGSHSHNNHPDPHVAPPEDEDEELLPASQHMEKELHFENMITTPFVHTVRSLDFWLIFVSCCGMWGTGAAFITNTIMIYDALAENQHHKDAATGQSTKNKAGELCVALMGVGSALGRVVAGSMNDWVSHRFRLAASILMIPCVVLMLVSIFILIVISGSSKLLWVPFFLNSLSYGASWAVMLLMVRQMFRRDIGISYQFMFESGVSSLIFSRAILGTDMDSGDCDTNGGRHCVLPLFLATGGCLVVSLLCAIALHYRWNRRNGLGFWEPLKDGNEPQKEKKTDLAQS